MKEDEDLGVEKFLSKSNDAVLCSSHVTFIQINPDFPEWDYHVSMAE